MRKNVVYGPKLPFITNNISYYLVGSVPGKFC